MKYFFVALIALGCHPVSTSQPEGGSSGTSNTVEQGAESAGSRIKLSMRRGGDGTIVRAGLYDTQWNTGCSLVSVTGEVGWRCIPSFPTQYAQAYLDQSCTQGITQDMGNAHVVDSNNRVYSLSQEVSVGSTTYASGSYGCSQSGTATAGFKVMEDITSQFVQFSEELQ